MKKNLVVLIAIVMAIGLVLAGCGQTAATSSAPAASSAAASQAPASEAAASTEQVPRRLLSRSDSHRLQWPLRSM